MYVLKSSLISGLSNHFFSWNEENIIFHVLFSQKNMKNEVFVPGKYIKNREITNGSERRVRGIKNEPNPCLQNSFFSSRWHKQLSYETYYAFS